MRRNALNTVSINTHIPTLQRRGVTVRFDAVVVPTVNKPDLVVQSPRVSKGTLSPGESFTLSATVRNSGSGQSAGTTLRYYRSTNRTISGSDTPVGTDAVGSLTANNNSAESITLNAPTTPGTYYYGACVGTVSNEADTTNNCSTAVSVTVVSAAVQSTATYMYWAEWNRKIQRSNLDGSNKQDILTGAVSDIALDVESRQMYWTEPFGSDKIVRANFDGSNRQELLTGLTTPGEIALDIEGDKMYWTARRDSDATNTIVRSNLDGSNKQDVITVSGASVTDVALDLERDQLYWAEWNPGKIVRSNLDGSNKQDVVTGSGVIDCIVLDVESREIYWAERVGASSQIVSADYDGSNRREVLTELDAVSSIALDVQSHQIYWTERNEEQNRGKIRRANDDGTQIQDLVTGLSVPTGIALGIPASPVATRKPDLVVQSPRVSKGTVSPGESFTLSATVRNSGSGQSAGTTLRYYRSTNRTISGSDTQVGTDAVGSLNANSNSAESITLNALTTPGTYYYGACVNAVSNEADTTNNCSTAVTVTVRNPADVNRDGVVDLQDIAGIVTNWEQRGQNNADVDGNGIVDVEDIVLVLAAIEATAAAPAFHAQGLNLFTAEQMQQWLIEAKALADKSPAHQRGILRLEQLLAILTPKATALLANYPNPFNPETWIPYRLAAPAEVTLRIYATNGQVVRTLAFGYQAAGFYEGRHRAAYWDGRNAQGEPVASGVYFYHLSAGDYSATRRMLILK